MGDPISTGAIFGAIGTCFRFAEFAVRVAEVGTENEVFVRKIQVVRNDLSETERLLALPSVQNKLMSRPGKLEWIRGSILSTKTALNEIGKWIEKARGEQQALGSVRFETRVRWVFNDHEKLKNRQLELTTCHLQLSTVLNFLIPLEDFTVTNEPPSYRDTTCFDDLIAPRQKRQSVAQQSVPIRRKAVGPSSGIPSLSSPDMPSYVPPETSKVSTTYSGGGVPNNAYPFQQDVRPLHVNRVMTSPTDSSDRSNDASWINSGVSNMVPYLGDTTFRSVQKGQALNPPLSPPLSPPPTYATATNQSASQLSTANTKFHEESKRYNNYYTTGATSERIDVKVDIKTPEAWAYRKDEIDQVAQELPGDTVTMTGTNFMGPVNPFELFGSHVPEKAQARPSIQETSTSVCSLPVELPSNSPVNNLNPGPPPGYPRFRPASMQVQEKLPITNVSELPASVPTRRPVSSTLISSPLIPIQELPTGTESYVSSRPTAHELPSSTPNTQDTYGFHPVPSQYSIPSESNNLARYSTTSLMPSPASNSASISPWSSPMNGHATLANPVERTVSPLTSYQPHSQPGVPTRADTTLSRRMQSQRTFMDLLGSIDRS